MGWSIAPALGRLRVEINTRWPNRSRVSDGVVGDLRHQASKSDHNPNSRGLVNAMDVTNRGIDVDELVARAIKHPATNYVISRGRIYSRKYGFRNRRYTGSNPHDHHVHISLRQARDAEQDTRPWGIKTAPAPAPAPRPPSTPSRPPSTPSRGDERPLPKLGAFTPKVGLSRARNSGARHGGVEKAQRNLAILGLYRLASDEPGRFGDDTERAVKELQRRRGLAVDGVIGPRTWAALQVWS